VSKAFQRSVVFGWVIQKHGGGGIKHAVCNKRFPLLNLLLKEVIKFADPTFRFTSIQVNQNVPCKLHRDSSNNCETIMIGFGNYKEVVQL